MESSRKTQEALESSYRPYRVANALMLIAIVLFIVFQPDLSGPTELWTAKTIWSCVAIGAILVTAGVFIMKGGLRLRQVFQSAREDRLRTRAGLPVDPEEPGR